MEKNLKKLADNNICNFRLPSIEFSYLNECKKTICDCTSKAGALYSGSFDVYNKKAAKVETVYIKEVIYNNPATIVKWSDGTKTVSRAISGDKYCEETGLLYCVIKKLSCNSLDKLFEEWVPKQKNMLNNRNVVTLKDVRKASK